MFLVLAVVVLAVGGAGPAAGGDQGAVQQHDFPALPGDRGEGAVQAGARAASSPMISQVHRWMVDAETPLPPAMSASRWSWRSVASTMRAILPGGSLRHREPIFLRWPRSRSATKVSVWRDSGSAHWQTSGVPSAG